LVVDDEPGFLYYSVLALHESNIEYVAVRSAKAAWEEIHGHPSSYFDMILLDVQMPGTTGWEFLAELRGAGHQIPVIFVTVHDAVEHRVRGLRLGADDYVIKPFQFEELVARIQAVLRRRSQDQIEIGDLRLDLARRRAECRGVPIDVSPREFELLAALAQARGRVMTRDELLREVWSLEFEPGNNVVDVHVGRLRRKLAKRCQAAIETVRRQGYRLVAREASSSANPPAA